MFDTHNGLTKDDLQPYRMRTHSWLVNLRLYYSRHPKTLAQRIARKMAKWAILGSKPWGVRSHGTAAINPGNATFEFDANNSQFCAIYQYGDSGYEIEVMASILRFLPADGVFLDVGSNWGFFSLAVARHPDFSGAVHAFEPYPKSIDDLNGIKAQLRIEDNRLSAHRVALSSASGETFLDGFREMYSGLVQVTDKDTGLRVEKSTLDQLEFDRVDVIKIDVEGHELEVLRGGEETITRLKPAIILESGYRRKRQDIEALKLLVSYGYMLYVPAVASEKDGQIVYDLTDSDSDTFGLKLMPFSPDQRGFFDRRVNVLALPRSRSAEGDVRHS